MQSIRRKLRMHWIKNDFEEQLDLDVLVGEYRDGQKIYKNFIGWYIPQFTPTLPVSLRLTKQTTSRVPSDMRFIEDLLLEKMYMPKNVWFF